jgi:hypothetical protein
MAQVAAGQRAPAAPGVPGSTGLSIEPPSSTFRSVQQPQGLFRIDRPDNWTAYVSSGDRGVTIVPRGGVTATANGQRRVNYGVIINHYVPFDGSVGASFTEPGPSSYALDDATADLVRHIEESNPYLSRVSGSERRRTIDGAPVFRVTLLGRSPQTGRDERVDVVTQQLPDRHVVYMLLVAPRDEYDALAPTFDRMVSSFRTDRSSIHR